MECLLFFFFVEYCHANYIFVNFVLKWKEKNSIFLEFFSIDIAITLIKILGLFYNKSTLNRLLLVSNQDD